jgi:hypothetical protein
MPSSPESQIEIKGGSGLSSGGDENVKEKM